MPFFFYVFVVIIGLIIGSFLNSLIWRLYTEESLWGRSYCPRCGHKISWYDNIPLLSFVLLGGRCRHCRRPISWQYPAVEFLTALLFLLVFLKDVSSPHFALLLTHDWLLIAGGLVILVFDWRWQLIPLSFVWLLSAVLFILNLLLGLPLLTLLFFGAIGAAFFLLQCLLTRGRGLGQGDIWLGLLFGLAFANGAQLLLLLILAYCLGALVSLAFILAGEKGWKSRLALAPFLVFGAIITLIWGERMINWYLGLF